MRKTLPALDAARSVLKAHGIETDRTEILQDASTLVVRLTETVVARVVQQVDGPRHGTAWFERENAVAAHLSALRAPVIPLHPDLPAGPHMEDGFPINFWEYVHRTETPLDFFTAGEGLARCHHALRSFSHPLPALAIVEESLEVTNRLETGRLLDVSTIAMLRRFLLRGLQSMAGCPQQPLHGDAHTGNLMQTTRGLVWTDWEDTFAGPVEWDVASALWNARFLDGDSHAVERFLAGYRGGGGSLEEHTLHACFETRAAVICAWYPLLYPEPDAERRRKLEVRLRWLAAREPATR
jgi:hypothetical protein